MSEGCYLIAEDTGATSLDPPMPNADPAAAVAEFLASNQAFTVDRECEKFLMTTHPGGYLRRLAAAT